MLEGERRDPGDVGLTNVPSFAGELVERRLDVDRVPKRDDVEGQAEGAELLLLLLAVDLPDLAPVAVANAPGQAVAELLAVELGQDAASLLLAVDVAEQVQCLHDAAEFGQRARQRCRTVLDLQNAHDGAGLDAAELERPRQAQQIFPVPGDEFGVDAMTRQIVEGAVMGGPVDAPEAGVADIGEPRAELVAQQPEQPEDGIALYMDKSS